MQPQSLKQKIKIKINQKTDLPSFFPSFLPFLISAYWILMATLIKITSNLKDMGLFCDRENIQNCFIYQPFLLLPLFLN